MEDDRIDIHRDEAQLAANIRSIEANDRILTVNRETLLAFLRAARAGRLARKGMRRRLSIGRCRKMAWMLKRFAVEINVPFAEVTVEMMERFILGTEDGTVLTLTVNGKPARRYTPSTVRDFRIIIRQFYRWVLADDPKRFEALTEWFDTRKVPPPLKTFGMADVERMAIALGCPQGRALIMLLFDGGFRAGELLNVRLRDVTFKPRPDGRRICFVRIRISKTRPRTISLPLASEAAEAWVTRHPQGGPIADDGTIRATDMDATLITWKYEYCRKVLHRAGQQELGERVYFHRFRHASATYYAKRLTSYQLCARFGWAMGSTVVERYIDHSGVLAEEVADVVARENAPARPKATTSDATVDDLVRRLRSNPELASALKAVLG